MSNEKLLAVTARTIEKIDACLTRHMESRFSEYGTPSIMKVGDAEWLGLGLGGITI